MVKSGTSGNRRQRFEQTALPYLDAIYTAALRLARNPDDAKDLLQETILRAYRCFHQFKAGTNCRAWLLTILYNIFRTAYRRNAREQLAVTSEEFEQEVEEYSFAEDSPSGNPEDLAAQREQLEAVGNRLSEQHEKVATQKKEFQLWAMRQREEFERQAAQLAARERDVEMTASRCKDLQQEWQTERRKYQQEIRRLLQQVRQDEREPAFA